MRCPAFLIVQMFSQELGSSSYDLATVHNSGIRGRHFVLTTRGAFEGAVVLIQQVGTIKKLGTVLFRKG